jgi:hypothetical protein
MPRDRETDVDWRTRARRGEAEAVVARLQCAGKLLEADARTASNARRLEEVTSTVSWRVTEPLRRMNAWRRALRQR